MNSNNNNNNNNDILPPSKPLASIQGTSGSNLGNSSNLQPPPPHSSSSTTSSSIQRNNNASSSQTSNRENMSITSNTIHSPVTSKASTTINPSTSILSTDSNIQSTSTESALAPLIGTSRRSNFQFTYDADNFLLSLIFKYKDELFTRGNTIKTWELVLYEFNQQFRANIIQSRTINNRFKVLRKNLDNKLMNETALPIQDLNLNENEKLLINLNQFLTNKELSKSTTASNSNPNPNNASIIVPSGGKSNVTNNMKYFESNINTSSINKEALNYKFPSNSTSYVAHSPQESIEMEPTSSTSPSFSIHLSPNIATQPTQGSQLTQQQQQIQQMQQLQQLQQIQSQQQSSQFPFQFLAPKPDLSFDHQPPQAVVAPPPPAPQQPAPPPPPPPPPLVQPQEPPQAEDTRFRKRIRSIPTTSSTVSLNQDLLDQLLIAQNEYNLQVNEIRKEIQDFKYDIDYKLKEISNKIDLNNDNLHVRLNNYFELLMTRRDVLEMETHNLHQQQGHQQHHQQQQQSSHHQHFQPPIALSQAQQQQSSQSQSDLEHHQNISRSLSHQQNSPLLSQQSQSTSQNQSQHQSPVQQH